jgi:hypothetical protein
MEIPEDVRKDMDALAGLDPVKEESPAPVVEEVPVVKTEEPVEEAAPPVEPVVEVPPLDTLATENERLRQELNELARRAGVQPKEAPVTPTPIPPAPASDVEFLSAEEAEAIMDDPKLLNKYLNKVYQAGREITMRDMPTLVRQQALMEITLQSKIQGFWAENKDLEPYKDFCSMVASQLEVENPSLGFDEVLTKTGEVARERLNLPKKGEVADAPSGNVEVPSNTPALPSGTRSARRPAPAPKPSDSQQGEMEDLAKAFGL